MTPPERRAAVSLGGIYALRMFGLFMILPVFALYAEQLGGVTPLLAGLAISIYGLTQALLQIPLGMLSDRFGRKRVIAVGLVVFAFGSVVAATADTIYGVILGRALQGSGAIAAAVMALAADLTREDQRTKIMAVIGMSIGSAFVVAMVAGPLLQGWIGLQGIFWVTAALAVLGLGVLGWMVPTPVRCEFHRDMQSVPTQFGAALRNSDLLRLDFGIFALHLILTATFVVLPLAIRDQGALEAGRHWQVYLPVLALSVLGMVWLIVRAERHGQMKGAFVGAVGMLLISQLTFANILDSFAGIVVSLVVFFTAFNFLEASLPSLTSRTAPAANKGTAMGVYSSSQFLGAFCGGVVGGWLHGSFGSAAVFWFGTGLAAFWMLVATGMRAPLHLSSYLLRVGTVDERDARLLVSRLNQIAGVAEAVVVVEDGMAYLKVDARALDEDSLRAFAVTDPPIAMAAAGN